MGFDGLFQYVDLISYVKPITIIDVYRNPIERSISNFLHSIGRNYLPNYINMNIKDVIHFYNHVWINKEQIFPESIDSLYTYLNIKKPKEFDFENNYIHQQHNNITIIKLKFDDLRVWNKRLSKIFNTTIEIEPSNVTKEKIHFKNNDFINDFKKNIIIHKTFLDKVMDDPNFNYFYSPDKRKAIYDEWINRTF